MKKEFKRVLSIQPRRRTISGGWHPCNDKEANEWAVVDQNREWVAEFATAELAAEYIRLTNGLPAMPGAIAITLPNDSEVRHHNDLVSETVAYMAYECGTRTMNPVLQEINESKGVVGVIAELFTWAIEFEEKFRNQFIGDQYLPAIQKFVNEKLETPVSRGTKQEGVHSGNVNA